MPRTPSMFVEIKGLALYPAGLTLPCYKIGTLIRYERNGVNNIRTERMLAYVNMNEDDDEISLGSRDTEENLTEEEKEEEAETQEFPTTNDIPVSQESEMSPIISTRPRGPPLRLRGPNPPTTSVVPSVVPETQLDQFWTEELVAAADIEIEHRKRKRDEAEKEKEWKLIKDDNDHDDNFCTICSQHDEQNRRIGRPWEIQCLHCPRGLCVSCIGQLRGHNCPFCRQNMFSYGNSDESEEDTDEEYVPPPPRRRRV